MSELPDRWAIDENGCWIWQAGLSTTGYGRTNRGYAHRISYEVHKGAIPEGLHIDHLCRVRACVNPDHLEAVTLAENNRRMGLANRSNKCKRGHAMTPDNILVNHRGHRQCRECKRLTFNEWQRKRRDADKRTSAGDPTAGLTACRVALGQRGASC